MLEIAQASLPMNDHLGANKCQGVKVLQHFGLLKPRRSVVDFVKRCYVCPRVGKPNYNAKTTPLKPVPAFIELFTRVIIDCVGPMPKTKSGLID